jgi:hypothetical protein
VSDYLILKPLTIEELVAQDSSVEDSFHFREGIWWRKIKPFFYQPAFFFQPIKPKSSSPAFCKALIGYHHVIPETFQANGHFRMMVHKDIKSYSFDLLDGKEKNQIRKALKFLEVKRITDVNDLLTDGYETYVSFRKRTNWGRDKTNYHIFSQWIKKAFKLEKRLLLGTYYDNKLIAYASHYAVQAVAAISIIISHSDYLKYYPNDLLLNTFLTICKNSPNITMAQFGPASLKPSLDSFKMKYGFETVKYPTYIWLNPFVKPLLKKFIRKKYKQLFGY